jgi:hypothetical protein
MIVLEERVHLLNFLARQRFDDEHSVIAQVEFGARFAARICHNWLRTRQRLAILNIVDGEAFAEVFEDEWTVLFELEVRRHIFPKKKKFISQFYNTGIKLFALLVEQMIIDFDF